MKEKEDPLTWGICLAECPDDGDVLIRTERGFCCQQCGLPLTADEVRQMIRSQGA